MAEPRAAGGSRSERSPRVGPAEVIFVFAMLCLMGLIVFAAYNISHTLGWVTAALLVVYVAYAGWRDSRQGAAGTPTAADPATDDPRLPASPAPDSTHTPVP